MSGFEAFLPLIIIVVAIVGLFCLKIREHRKVKRTIPELEEELREIQRKIAVSTGDSVPGWEVVETLGIARGISDTAANTKASFNLAEKEALLNMLKTAQGMGANGVINVRSTSGTYEMMGFKWQVSQVIYTGTAVKVRRKK